MILNPRNIPVVTKPPYFLCDYLLFPKDKTQLSVHILVGSVKNMLQVMQNKLKAISVENGLCMLQQ